MNKKSMPEEFKIEVESTGHYETKKEFNKKVQLTEREYLSLVNIILDHLDFIEKNNHKEE